MKLVKENFIPTLIILLAGLIVSFAVVPLQNTEWADTIRAAASVDVEANEGFEGEDAPTTGALMMLLPLVKVAIFMGVGAALTALIAWIIRLFKRTPSRAATSKT